MKRTCIVRRFRIVLVTVLIVAAGVAALNALSVSASGHIHSMADQKKCKKGQHRVHGTCKKKHAAAPMPTSTPTLPAGYVALGDSLTAGVGTDNEATQSYPALLAAHLPSGTRFLNLGESGYKLDNAIMAELPQALAAHPPLATVWLGTNDALLGTCPEVATSCATEVASFSTGLDHMLSALHDAHVRVFVANLPDFHIVPATAGGDPQYCKGQCWIPGIALNAVIATVASRYGDSVVDVYAASKPLWGRPEFVSDDGLHLTEAGYAALADLFYGVMHAQGALP